MEAGNSNRNPFSIAKKRFECGQGCIVDIIGLNFDNKLIVSRCTIVPTNNNDKMVDENSYFIKSFLTAPGLQTVK
jgi:hypothetical protein